MEAWSVPQHPGSDRTDRPRRRLGRSDFWPKVVARPRGLRRYIEKDLPDHARRDLRERCRFFHPDECQANVLWRMRGSGPPPSRRRQAIRVRRLRHLPRFHDGRLSHYQAAYDITDMMRQLEMLPSRGSDRRGLFLALPAVRRPPPLWEPTHTFTHQTAQPLDAHPRASSCRPIARRGVSPGDHGGWRQSEVGTGFGRADSARPMPLAGDNSGPYPASLRQISATTQAPGRRPAFKTAQVRARRGRQYRWGATLAPASTGPDPQGLTDASGLYLCIFTVACGCLTLLGIGRSRSVRRGFLPASSHRCRARRCSPTWGGRRSGSTPWSRRATTPACRGMAVLACGSSGRPCGVTISSPGCGVQWSGATRFLVEVEDHLTARRPACVPTGGRSVLDIEHASGWPSRGW